MKKTFLILLIAIFAITGCSSNIETGNVSTETEEDGDMKIGNKKEIAKRETFEDGFLEENISAKETKKVLQKRSSDSLKKLIKTSYPQKELLDIVFFGGSDNLNTTITSYDEKFPIESLRTFEDGSLTYCVYKLDEGGFLYIFFHGYGNDVEKSLLFTNYAFIVNKLLTEESFESIKPGSTLADVENIDTSKQLFREANVLGLLVNGESYHMVNGGFMRIEYDVPEEWDNYNPYEYIVKSVEFVPNGSDLITKHNKVYGTLDLGLGSHFKYTVLEEDYPQ